MKRQLKAIKLETTGDIYYPLPIVDTNNNGKALMVSDGAWTISDKEIYTEINNVLQQSKDYADSLLGGESYNDKYSTEESVSGQWIDGRPIYRKVVTINSVTFSNNEYWARYYFTTQEVAAMNVDFYTNVRGMVKTTSDVTSAADNTWQPIPRICPDAIADYSIGVGDLTADTVGVLFGTRYTGAAPIYLILDYVKKS